MFRRLSKSLPRDPEFPTNLEDLGYFINDKDQIRSIENPHRDFHYFISKNERVLDMHREAFNICIRENVRTRLREMLKIGRLPMNARKHDPHVPIFISSNLTYAKRVIVFFGESIQDLGIFAYRIIGQNSIAAGSAIDFVKDILTNPDPSGEVPAIILANMGQLLWSNRLERAMTSASFLAIPKKTAVDHSYMIDEVRNRVPGNSNQAEHVKFIFEVVIQKMVSPKAVIDIIGIDDGAAESVEYLQANWAKWEKRIQAIAIGIPYLWKDMSWDEGFTSFWSKRARAYMVSHEPLGTPLTGRKEIRCNCYSSGSPQHLECIMPEAYKNMLAFFRLVEEVPGYEEVEVLLEEEMALEQVSDDESFET